MFIIFLQFTFCRKSRKLGKNCYTVCKTIFLIAYEGRYKTRGKEKTRVVPAFQKVTK